MNALTLQDLLKYKIIGHSSFQNLDFLVVTSFVPPSASSKYIAYFIPSWKKYHSKLCHCRMCSSWAVAVGISYSCPVVHFSFMMFYLVSVFCFRQIWIPATFFLLNLKRFASENYSFLSSLSRAYSTVSKSKLLVTPQNGHLWNMNSSHEFKSLFTYGFLSWPFLTHLSIFPASSSFSLPWLGH